MIRILIADDHEVVREGLRRFIEAQPDWHVVAEASDGKEAIRQAVMTNPDVAVLDIWMPLINGIAATRQIRARLPSTEVLIFTVQDDDDLIRECLKAGARSYLLKSEMEGQLRRAIKSLAAHEPFFTGRVSQALLDSFLDAPTQSGTRLKTSESNVLQLLAGGHTNEEIARRLNLSLKLVETLVRVASHSDLLHSIE